MKVGIIGGFNMAGFDPNLFMLAVGTNFINSVFLVAVAYRSKMPTVMRAGFFILGLLLLISSLALFWLLAPLMKDEIIGDF